MKNVLLLLSSVTLFTACMSHEILPEKVEVKVSRDEPSTNCKPLGVVTGRTIKFGQTSSDALNDMKEDAARKGANYVQYDGASAMGTALQGTAYYCP